MRFGRISRGATVAFLAVGAWVAVSAPALAQKSEVAQEKEAEARGRERASGVIVKVDRPKTEDSKGPSHLKLTINTNVVWRDWARDQSQTRDKGPAGKDARKGRESVGTVGEPADPYSVVVVVVEPETRIRTRFRSPVDETTTGSEKPDRKRSDTRKAVRFHADDLKPGLFVEVDYHRSKSQEVAIRVSVIRPIGGPDSGSADKPK
jgi:hypothetical protein